MGRKSDRAEIARRVEEVLRVRLDGAQFHDIVQYGSERGWNVSGRQIRKYIARADALLVERQDRSRTRVVARHLARCLSLQVVAERCELRRERKVTRLGFEPRQREPKSLVLPLHYRVIGRTRRKQHVDFIAPDAKLV